MEHAFFKLKYPELMPVSTLLCPPSISYIQAVEKASINMGNNNKKNRSESMPKNIYHMSLNEMTKKNKEQTKEINETIDKGDSFENNIKVLSRINKSSALRSHSIENKKIIVVPKY